MVRYQPGDAFKMDWYARLQPAPEMVELQLDKFFKSDGSLDIEAIQELLETNPEYISDLEWAALAALIFDTERVSYEDIYAIFNYFSDRSGGQYVKQTTEKLGQLLSRMTFLAAGAYLLGEDIDEDIISEMLRRSQLVSFMPGIYMVVRDSGSDITYYLIKVEKLDVSRLDEGIIGYDGTDYPQQVLSGLMGNESASDFRNALTKYMINEAYGKDYTWAYGVAMMALSVVGLIAGFYTAPVWTTVGTVLGVVGVADSAIDILLNGILNSDKSAREKANDLNNLATAIDLLGGRIMYTTGPDGAVMMNHSMASAEAMIKLNGLQRDLNISEEEALKILADENHPQYNQVKDYVSGYKGGPVTYTGYTGELNTTYNKNFAEIQDQFKEKYPDLDPNTQADMLPLDVLQEVIEMEAKENEKMG
jgi:hypothetical protein